MQHVQVRQGPVCTELTSWTPCCFDPGRALLSALTAECWSVRPHGPLHSEARAHRLSWLVLMLYWLLLEATICVVPVPMICAWDMLSDF